MLSSRPAEASDVRRWATQAWSEMDAAGVVPTPQNFELWFRHASGANAELSVQIHAARDLQPAMTQRVLEALYDNFPAPGLDVDAIVDRAEGMQRAAQTMVADVISEGEHIRHYGRTLSHWTTQLGQSQTVENLFQAVATLAGETERAGERNQALEQKLSASSAQISRLKDSMAKLKVEATTDVLTGLANRKAFNGKLRRALSNAKLQSRPVSVLLFDVDHFKRVNDTYGHQTGDLVLRLIGRLLADSVKGHDTPARYGGEEFAVLLVGADLKAGVVVADRIRVTLESKELVKKRTAHDYVPITVSVGVAQVRPGEAAGALLERADAAMYQAKQRGRNQVFAAQEIEVRAW